MNKILKTLFVISTLVLLVAGCKKDPLPEESSSSVKSYDFYAAGGVATKDKGFIVYCNDNFLFGTINDKIVKLGADGKIEWQYSYNSFFNDTSYDYNYMNIIDIGAASDGYVALGIRDSNNIHSLSYIKFNSSGQKIIERNILTPQTVYDHYNILALTNGNVLIVNIDTAYALRLISGIGDSIWTKTLSTTNYSVNKMTEAGNGDFVFIGPSAYVAKVKSDGSSIDERYYPIPKSYGNNYFDIIPTPDNNYLIAGCADVGTAITYQYNYSLTLVDQNLDTLWMKTLGTIKQDYCLSVVANTNGYALAGISNYNISTATEDYASSAYVLRVDKNGKEVFAKNIAEGLSSKGLLISANPDNSLNILGTKLAYGNPGLHHTIYVHTKLE